MAAIGTLTIEMAANVARLQRDMDSARKSVDGAMAKITKAANLAKGALGALGAGLSVVGISNFVKGVANAADEIGKMAQRTGVAAADLQKLKFAAEMSGVSVNSLGTALQIMSRNLQGATEESKAASKGFDALSINVKNADGSLKSTTQLMTEVANRFSRMEDGAQKTALAMQLFGRSGAELIPMLNEGEAGLRNMFKEAERLGIVMNDDLIKASTAFNDSLSQIQGELKGLMISAVGPFIQRLAEITTRFVEARQAGLSFFQSLVRGFTQTTIIEDLTTEIGKLEKEIAKLEGARRGPGMQRRGQIQEMNERLVVLRKNLDEAQAKLNETPPALQKFTVAVAKSADDLKRLADIQRYYNQQTDEFFANEEKKRQALEDSIRVGREMIEDLEFEAKALKMTNQEREIAIRLRKLEIAGIKEGSAAYEELAARIREAVAGRDAIAEGIQQQRKLAEEWQKTTDEINRTLTDALMRAFEAGKGFGKAFKDTMVNLFRTMILRPILAPIVAGLTGGITPAMGADGGTTTLSIVSGLKTTYDMITKGFANIGATVSESLLRAGDYLATSSSDFLANSGTFLQNISQTAGTIASSVAAAAAGIALNTIISGGYSMGKGMDTFQKVGIAVASYINPVLGVVIGALTGVVNRLFGRKLADVGLEGTFGPGGFTGSQYEFYKGGVFRSDKTKRFGLDEELTMGFSSQFQSLRNATFLMAATLGEVSEDILGFTKSIKISFKGLSEDQIQQRIAEEFENIADEMAALIPNLLDFQRIGESSSETLQRLFNSASAANQAFDTLSYSFRVTTLATADMASQLIDLFGGVERFGQVTEQFFMDFYSEAERTSTITRQLTEALAMFGLELPQTREAYRQLAEAQDLTTDAGRRTYAMLLQLSPTFASLTQQAQQFNNAMQERESLERRLLTLLGNTVELRRRELEATNEANRGILRAIFAVQDQQEFMQNAQSAADAAYRQAQAATDAAMANLDRMIRKQKEALELTRKTAEEQAQSIKSVFDVLNDAILNLTGGGFTRSGGRAFIEQALRTAQATGYLPDSAELQRAIGAATRSGDFGSSFEQRKDQALLVTRLTQLRTFSSNQLTVAEEQLLKIDRQLQVLDEQLENAKNQVALSRGQLNSLHNIEGGIQTIPQAIGVLQSALTAELKLLGALTMRNAPRGAGGLRVSGAVLDAALGAFNLAVASGDYATAAALASSAGASPSQVADYVNANLGGLGLSAPVTAGQVQDIMTSSGYAAGGLHDGGMRVVGERGPELEVTGPARYMSNATLASMMNTGASEEIKTLREENKAQMRSLVSLQSRMTRLLERWDGDGLPEERVVA